MRSSLPSFLFLLLGGLLCCQAMAAPPSVGGDAAIRRTLVRTLLSTGTPPARLLDELADSGSPLVREVLTAWTRGEIYLCPVSGAAEVPVLLDDQQDASGKSLAIRIDDGRFLLDAAGRELRFSPDDLNSVEADLRLRSAIQQVLDTLELADPDEDVRRAAVVKLGYSQKMQYRPVLQARLGKEKDAGVRKALREALAQLELGSSDPAVKISAIQRLAQLGSIGSLDSLQRLAAASGNPPAVAQAARRAVQSIQEHITWVNFFGTVFRGVSLGSVLLVVALGLAITFGLMGIINMAHGEMVAIGAYTCYVVQNVFGSGFESTVMLPFSFFGHPIAFGLHLPGLNTGGRLYDSYFLFAIPLSFLTAALAGVVLERLVIRFLYRRPLESLLATWGVSLALQQGFRMVFGANNVQVNSPSWLLGHFTFDDVMLDYNRVFVIGFAVLIVLGLWLLLTRTPLGLFIRAVMQNRDMASCLGVRSNRVNLLTFAIGSGLAGLAGAFLSQIGNVGPSLGQTYIVDSFMTVVAGGVGSLAGTVYAALGIGTVDQILQQIFGSPVMGKVVVLCVIILFLQWKPGGLFTARSRSLED